MPAAERRDHLATDEKELGTYEARASVLTFGDFLDDSIKDCRRRHKIGDRMSGKSLNAFEQWWTIT